MEDFSRRQLERYDDIFSILLKLKHTNKQRIEPRSKRRLTVNRKTLERYIYLGRFRVHLVKASEIAEYLLDEYFNFNFITVVSVPSQHSLVMSKLYYTCLITSDYNKLSPSQIRISTSYIKWRNIITIVRSVQHEWGNKVYLHRLINYTKVLIV